MLKRTYARGKKSIGTDTKQKGEQNDPMHSLVLKLDVWLANLALTPQSSHI